AEFDHDPDLYWGYQTIESRPLFGMVNAPSVFSDAMFITTKDCSSSSLCELTDYCNAVFQVFLGHKLPMRGVIARGEVLVWKEQGVLLGPGIVNAYLLQEAVQIVGVAAAGNIGDHANLGAQIDLPDKDGQQVAFRLLRRLIPPLTQLVSPSKEELMRHYLELRQAAEEKGDPRVIRKYVNGTPVVESMLG
ncbi:MAG: hypothetical protein K2Z81_14620, partial [Cyanobacteria bacterium]|nr:hypothetical protein [Cyanobacteriota bacterium]